VTTLGGSTLREPVDPVQENDSWTGQRSEAHDGTVLVDFTNPSRLKWSLSWTRATQAEKDALYTGYLATASQVFVPPHTSASFAVYSVRGTWDAVPYKVGANPVRYDVKFELEEIS